MDHKHFQIKSVAPDGTGRARIATLNVIDKDGDVTLPGAFGNQSAKILPAHNWNSIWLGKANVYEQGNEVLADLRLNLDIPAARDWHSALKFDLANGQPIAEYSYGYSVIKASPGEFDGQRVRFLEELKVHEVSPVVAGAGVGTGTLALKHHPAGVSKIARAEFDKFHAISAQIDTTTTNLKYQQRYAYKVIDILPPDEYAELCHWSIKCCDTLGCPQAVPLTFTYADRENEEPDFYSATRLSGAYYPGKTLGGHPVVYVKVDEMNWMRETVAHECAHVWQHHSRKNFTDAKAEQHAETFAAKMVPDLDLVERQPVYSEPEYRGLPTLPAYALGNVRCNGGYMPARKVFAF